MSTEPKYISDLIQNLKKAKSRDEIYNTLDAVVEKNPQFRCVDDILYVGDNYQFKCTLKHYTEILDFNAIKRDIPNIESMQTIHIGDSGMSVVVSKFKERQ